VQVVPVLDELGVHHVGMDTLRAMPKRRRRRSVSGVRKEREEEGRRKVRRRGQMVPVAQMTKKGFLKFVREGIEEFVWALREYRHLALMGLGCGVALWKKIEKHETGSEGPCCCCCCFFGGGATLNPFSSRHCFWHIWQYHLSFWRPLALIRLEMALGVRKPPFLPIWHTRRKKQKTFLFLFSFTYSLLITRVVTADLFMALTMREGGGC